jgi:hypothetical protein
MASRWITRILKIILGIFILVVVIGAVGEGVLQLWNWLLPPLFGWRTITFWQALMAPLQLAAAHRRALGEHDSRRAREIPSGNAGTLRTLGSRRASEGAKAMRERCCFRERGRRVRSFVRLLGEPSAPAPWRDQEPLHRHQRR